MNSKSLVAILLCLASFAAIAQKQEIKDARAYLADSELAKAKTSIDAAVAHKKGVNNKEAWILRGDIYAKSLNETKETVLAQTAFDSYVKAEGLGKSGELDNQFLNLANYCFAIGAVAERMKTYQEAIDIYMISDKCATRVKPKDAQVKSRIAHCYFMAEKYDKSIELYKVCIANEYNLMDSYAGIDYCYQMSWDYSNTDRIANIEEALTKLPDNERILSTASEIYTAAGDFTQAEEMSNKLIELYPESPTAHFSLGNVMYEAMNHALQKGEKESSVEAYFNRAETSYLKALELIPNNSTIVFSIGNLYYNRAMHYDKQGTDLGFSKEEVKQFDELREKSDALMKKSLPYFQQYFKGNYDDTATENVLKSIYLRLEMVEEYKALTGE